MKHPMPHTVLVRLVRDQVDELRLVRLGGRSAFIVSDRAHTLFDLLEVRGRIAPYKKSVVEAIDGHRLNDGQSRLNAAHDPWWFVPMGRGE
jgi:hypothetical protein